MIAGIKPVDEAHTRRGMKAVAPLHLIHCNRVSRNEISYNITYLRFTPCVRRMATHLHMNTVSAIIKRVACVWESNSTDNCTPPRLRSKVLQMVGDGVRKIINTASATIKGFAYVRQSNPIEIWSASPILIVSGYL